MDPQHSSRRPLGVTTNLGQNEPMTAAELDRDTSGFARASHQSQALCLGTLGVAGLLVPVAMWGFDSLPRLLFAVLCAGFGLWQLHRAHRHWTAHTAALAGGSAGSSDPAPVHAAGVPATPEPHPQFPALYEGGRLHPTVQRLLEVAQSQFPGKLIPVVEAFEFEDDGVGGRKLIHWAFRCADPGYLAEDGVSNKVTNAFRKSLGGIWSLQPDPRSDTFTGSRKTKLKKVVYPPLWPVVTDYKQARANYTGWQYKVGVSSRGEEGVAPGKMAHVMCIGESGSGKSVAVRSWLEQFRAAGWQLIIADGKGADYAGYFKPHPEDHNLPVPGVVAVGIGGTAKGLAYVGAITLAYKIMQERQQGSLEAKISDPDGWMNYTPVLLVMDEVKGMRERWRNSLPRPCSRAVESMVTEILALGREFRVHVLLVSQDARDVSIPGVWKSNIPQRICLGKPRDVVSLNHIFEESVRQAVRQITEAMDPALKGRCVYASVDQDTGATKVFEYQGYLGYAPGESWAREDLPTETSEHWPPFKAEVSDKIPRMYTRQWFQIDDKPEAQLEAEANGLPDLGYIDFDQFTVEELKLLKRVPLDMRRGGPNGPIVPDPAMAKYDPSSPEYVCKPPSSGQVVRAEL